MSLEVKPLRSTIFIPANKQSAWVYKQGTKVTKDPSKEHQGMWAFPGFTLEAKNPVEVWVFRDDDKDEIDKRVLENNPLQGAWGYKLDDVKNTKKVNPEDMIFYPPDSKVPKSFKPRGLWVKPVYKRDMSALAPNSSGFMVVSDDIRKAEKHSVGGTWKMLGHNDEVVRGKKSKSAGDGGDNGKWKIFVRTHKGEVFPIPTIPGSRISKCKEKIFKKRGIPIDDQRLSFEGEPLKDEKTLVGSGVRNGDTIDLGPMEIFVRTPKGKKFLFEVDHDDPIEAVKELAEPKVNIPVKDQRLTFKRVPLEDGNPLSKYKVRHRNVLDLGGMIIFVKPLEGPTIELDVEPLDTIRSVKIKVKNRIKMDPKDQHLFFGGNELTNDEATLSDYNIKHRDTLVMRETSPAPKTKTMIIYVVKDWDNEKFQLSVEKDNLILDVKTMIEARENIPVDKQILTFKRKPVEEPKTLTASGIKNKSTLHLEPRSIILQFPSGDQTKLKVKPTEPIDKIQDRIAEDHDIPKDKQALWHRNKPVDPARTLDQCDIDDDEPIVVKRPGKPKIKVRPEKGRPFDIIMEPNETVKDLKDKVGKKINRPPRRFDLVPEDGGEPLGDDDTPKQGVTYLPVPCKPPEIAVTAPNGRNFTLLIDPDDTIKDIKKKLVKPSGFPSKQMRLVDEDGNEPADDSKPRPGRSFTVQPPQIEVACPGKDKVKLDVLPTQTIGDIKDIIEEKCGVPKDKQRIFFLDKDKELDDDTPAFKAGVKDGTTLEVRPDDAPTEITIKPPDGRSFVLVVDPDETIPTLKRKVAKKIGVPVKSLALRKDDGKPVKKNTKLSPGDVLIVDPPKISIELPDHGPIDLPLTPLKTIQDIKDEIEKTTGIPASKQRIFYVDNDKDELNDDTPLSKTDVKPGTTLRMTAPDEVQIPFKAPNGRTFFLDLDPSDTLKDVKDKVAKRVNLQPGDVRVLIDDDEIDDDFDFSRVKKTQVLSIEPTNIDVKLPNGDPVSVPLLPTMTIDDVKEVIEEKTGIPKANQRIFHLDPDDDVDGSTPVKKLDLPLGESLQMKLPDVLEIPVKTNGRTFVLQIDPDDTVDAVKQKAGKRYGLAPDEIKVFVNDEEVDEEFDFTRVKKTDVVTVEPTVLKVKMPNGEPVSLELLPTMTVDDVKDVIEEKTGIPKANQRIFHLDPDDDVDGSTPVKKLDLPLGESLQMKLPDVLEIPVKTNGRTFVLQIDPDDTVDAVKQKAGKRYGLAPDEIKVFVNDEEVDEEFDFTRVKKTDVVTVEPTVLKVKMPNGEPVSLELLPTMTVDDVKDVIEEKTGVPKSNQRIFFLDADDDALDGDTPLKKLDLPLGESLQMKLPDVLEIPVKTNGRTFVLQIDPDDTVDAVKQKAGKRYGLAPDEIKVFVNDEEVDEEFDFTRVKKTDVVTVEPTVLKVKMPNGEPVSLELLPTMTVDDVKDVIEEKTGVPKSNQRIFFLDADDDALDGDTPLKKLDLPLGESLQMKLPDELEIPVKTSTGRTFVLQIDPDDTLNEVKQKAGKRYGLAPDKIKVFVNDEEVDEEFDFTRMKKTDVLTIEPTERTEVKMPNGEPVSLALLPTMTVDEVKDVIEEKTGVSKSNQRIFFLDADDSELDGNTTLKKLKFEPGGCLEMKLPDEMEIPVKTSNGRSFVLQIDPEENVEQAKRKVAKKFNLAPTKVRVFLNDDDESLDDEFDFSRLKRTDVLRIESDAIEVSALLPNGEKAELSILPTQTMAEIRELLMEQSITQPKANHRFCFLDADGEKIDDDETFEKVEIEGGTLQVVEVETDPPGREVSFKTREGRTFILTIVPDDTVRDVKKKLTKFGIPVGGFMLGDLEFDMDEDEVFLDTEDVKPGVIFDVEPPVIEIEIPGTRRKVKMTILPTTTIEDIKNVIEAEVPEFKVTKQRLFFCEGDDELSNDVLFTKLKLEQGLQLEVRSFEIFVEHWDGEAVTVDVETTEYMDDIRNKICELLAVPIEEQRLTFQGQPVRDDLTLKEQGIQPHSTLVLEPFKLIVADVSGRRHTLFPSMNDSVKSIKKTLYQRTGIPVDVQCLMNGGEELPNLQSLRESNVEHLDVVLLEVFLIYVMDWLGDVHIMEGMDPHDSIDTLKQRIAVESKVPENLQRLTLNGKLLQVGQTLDAASVSHKSIIVLEDPNSNDITLPDRGLLQLKLMKMKKFKSDDTEIWPVVPDWNRRIFFFDNEVDEDELVELTVMHWSGKNFILKKVHLGETVEHIKKRIFERKRIPVEKQHVAFDGKLLDKRKTLRQQMVKHKSVLVLQGKRKRNFSVPDAKKISFGVLPTKILEDIRIKVKHWNGDTIEIDARPTDYIDDLKESVSEKIGLSPDDQFLLWKGSPVDEQASLEDQGIEDGSKLVLDPPRISIETPRGELLKFVVELEMTVETLKSMISKKTRIEVDTMCILFGGMELEKESSLIECSIDRGDVLKLEEYTLSVAHASGEVFTLEHLKPGDKISAVKKAILEKKYITTKRQKLSFQGKELKNSVTLESEGVQHKAVLVLDEIDIAPVAVPRQRIKLNVGLGIATLPTKEKFELVIQHWNGDQFRIDSDPLEYADDVRDTIMKLKGIPVEHQRLLYKNQYIRDDHNIGDQGIKSDALIRLEAMKIVVDVPGGKRLRFETEMTQTIAGLKSMIAKKGTVDVEKQCIIFGGEELENDKTLQACGVKYNDSVRMEVFSVSVLHWSGVPIPVDNIGPTSTLKRVKAKVVKRTGMSQKEFQLTLKGNVLTAPDDTPISDLDIGHKSILMLEQVVP